MSDHRQLEPWGGELRVPGWVRRLLRRPRGSDTPERSAERGWEQRHPKDGPSVQENVDRAIFGGFSEAHPGNREAPRSRRGGPAASRINP
jgi:hypothetical protein